MKRPGLRMVFSVFALQLALVACTDPFEFDTNTKYAYLRPGQPITLQDTLRPVVPNAPLVSVPGCEFTPDEIERLPSEVLTPIHNDLVERKKQAAATAGSVKRWVESSANVPDTFAGLMLRTASASADLQYGAGPSGAAGGENSSVTFVAVDMRHQVNLTGRAEKCLKLFVCAGGVGSGSYYRSAIYGSLVRLKVNSGKYSLKGDSGNNVLPVKVKVEASTSDFQIEGGFIGGRSKTSDEVAALLNTKLISKAIQERDMSIIVSRLRSLGGETDPIGIVAVERVVVDCAVR